MNNEEKAIVKLNETIQNVTKAFEQVALTAKRLAEAFFKMFPTLVKCAEVLTPRQHYLMLYGTKRVKKKWARVARKRIKWLTNS